MPDLRIPDENRKILAKLALLAEPQAREFIAVLGSIPPGKLEDYLSAGAKAAKTIDPRDMKGFLETLFSLHTVRAYREVATGDFLKDVLGALGEQGESLTEANRNQLSDILSQALGVKSLSVSVKSYSLQREHLCLFHDAKIISDLRPVFDSPSEPPVGLTVTYTLHVVFHKGSQRNHEDIYFSLDADDIDKLKAIVERAQAKATSLKRLLSDKGLTQLE